MSICCVSSNTQRLMLDENIAIDLPTFAVEEMWPYPDVTRMHPLGAFLGGEKKCLGRIILISFSTRCLFGSYYPSHCTQSKFFYPPLCQAFLRILIHFPIFSLLPLGLSFLAMISYRNSFIIQQAFIEHLICAKPKVKKTDMIVCLMELIVWSELRFLVHR